MKKHVISNVLLYVGSIAITLWGIGHVYPTKSIVAGFGTLSMDNRRIITMEWVAEGLTLIFVGLLVLVVTALAGSQSPVSILVFRAAAAMLLVMAGWSLMTGARTSITPMRLCPLVKSTVAVLFILASVL